jgi:hypothetical protein
MAGRGATKKPAGKKKQSSKNTSVKASSRRGTAGTTATKKAVAKKRPIAKKKAVAKKLPVARKKAVTSTTAPPATERSPMAVVGASPSGKVLAACAEVPNERPLTDEEREAMAKVAETARRFVEADGAPPAIVDRIAAFVDDVRHGRRDEPRSQDVRLGLGVLWGEQLRAQVGWCWVHLTYPDGFASYALVPDDRAFACFPLNRVPEALRPGGSNTSAHVFESIRAGTLPARKSNAYLVIG